MGEIPTEAITVVGGRSLLGAGDPRSLRGQRHKGREEEGFTVR